MIVAVVFLALFIFPIQSAQQTTQIISSHGMVDVKDRNLNWLHTDGKYIKDELGNIVLLRGVCLYEVPSYVDHLKYDKPISQQVKRLKELGVNYIRLPINKADWDSNRDTNGDGIGARDFNYQVIDAFTEAGIYVFAGLMYGVSESEEEFWAANPQIMVDWYVDNILNRYQDNPGVHLFIWNEPNYGQWGGSDLGGGVTSGYWNAMKHVCQAIYNINPNVLMVVHADMWNDEGFCPVLKTDPIPTPNVIYTWHYYYCYAPQYNPYLGWMSGVLDPDYQELVNRGMPFYQSYYYGNYAKAKQEFEQWLYDRFLWVPTELNLPIVNDEFGFTADIESYFSMRACPECGWYGQVVETLDSPNGNPVKEQNPYPDVTYCPQCGGALPKPREHVEPGWPQCMKDLIEIMEKYYCNWNYFAWWTKDGANYGACLDDMTTLSEAGEVIQQHLSTP